MEQSLERQVVRTASALVVASVHTTSTELIVEMRDRAFYALSLRLKEAGCLEELALWCRDAGDLLQEALDARVISADVGARTLALILKLRLSVLRSVTAELRMFVKNAGDPAMKKQPQQDPPPKITLTENTKKVLEYIKSNKDIRTKELIDHFTKQFSSRSTKRYLSELLAQKILQRRVHPDGGVSYVERV